MAWPVFTQGIGFWAFHWENIDGSYQYGQIHWLICKYPGQRTVTKNFLGTQLIYDLNETQTHKSMGCWDWQSGVLTVGPRKPPIKLISFTLREMDTASRFSIVFIKGDNFHAGRKKISDLELTPLQVYAFPLITSESPQLHLCQKAWTLLKFLSIVCCWHRHTGQWNYR